MEDSKSQESSQPGQKQLQGVRNRAQGRDTLMTQSDLVLVLLELAFWQHKILCSGARVGPPSHTSEMLLQMAIMLLQHGVCSITF